MGTSASLSIKYLPQSNAGSFQKSYTNVNVFPLYKCLLLSGGKYLLKALGKTLVRKGF